MINPDFFAKNLKKNGYSFAVGVPDSLLKELSNNFIKTFNNNHIISTNEGSAIGLAIGYYLGKRKPAIIYLQNSGLGNLINPLNSLANPKVYGIPMLLIIGWRGEIKKNKQISDEPQHKFQGLITLKQLNILNVPYKIIHSKTKNIKKIIKDLRSKSIKFQSPVALVVRKNTFSKSIYKSKSKLRYGFKREDVIKKIVLTTQKTKNIIVATTGMASRELYETRVKNKDNNKKDFLTVGGMGHASQIASGIGLTTKKKIICIDGDGSFLMHSGALGISAAVKNLVHIVINNMAHDSVGGQPTLGNKLNFKNIAKEFGYNKSYSTNNLNNFTKILKNCLKYKNSSIIIVNCDKGYRKNLGRPERNMLERKEKFLKLLHEKSN